LLQLLGSKVHKWQSVQCVARSSLTSICFQTQRNRKRQTQFYLLSTRHTLTMRPILQRLASAFSPIHLHPLSCSWLTWINQYYHHPLAPPLHHPRRRLPLHRPRRRRPRRHALSESGASRVMCISMARLHLPATSSASRRRLTKMSVGRSITVHAHLITSRAGCPVASSATLTTHVALTRSPLSDAKKSSGRANARAGQGLWRASAQRCAICAIMRLDAADRSLLSMRRRGHWAANVCVCQRTPGVSTPVACAEWTMRQVSTWSRFARADRVLGSSPLDRAGASRRRGRFGGRANMWVRVLAAPAARGLETSEGGGWWVHVLAAPEARLWGL